MRPSSTPIHALAESAWRDDGADDLAAPDAVEGLVRALEQATTARLDLAVHGITSTAQTWARSAAALMVALMVAGLAWVCLGAGAATLLSSSLGWGWSLVLVGVGQGIIAAVVAVVALRAMVSIPVTPGQNLGSL